MGRTVCRCLLVDPGSNRSATLARSLVGRTLVELEDPQHQLAQFMQVLSNDGDLYAHSMNVCLYGLTLAQAIAIDDPEELQDLGVGLLLHDIGMLSLPRGVLNSTEKLRLEDLEIARLHPAKGLERVESLEWIGEIARDVIRNHHRWVDGGGYPDAGGELSIYSRLAMIVNAFDSRSCNRAWRSSVTMATSMPIR